jgi:hypothetical protein
MPKARAITNPIIKNVITELLELSTALSMDLLAIFTRFSWCSTILSVDSRKAPNAV